MNTVKLTLDESQFVVSIEKYKMLFGEFSVACANRPDEQDAELPYEEPEPVRRRAIALRGIPVGAD